MYFKGVKCQNFFKIMYSVPGDSFILANIADTNGNAALCSNTSESSPFATVPVNQHPE